MNRIMVVDDEQAIRDSLRGLFEDEDYRVICAASGEEAVARFRKEPADCVLLDIWMPGIDGLETLVRLKKIDESVPVVMMSGHATIDTAVRATRQGAFDFVEKPLSSDKLLILVRNAMEKRKLARENTDLKQHGGKQRPACDLIGKSAVMNDVRSQLQQAATTDAPVLILGESGTGKTVAAKLLHQSSRRAEAAFVAVNTASIADARIDAELFGHEKGAFPGALHAQRGCFEAAKGGSLFFDEVMDLSLAAQAKVLRVLQEGTIQRLGGAATLPVNIRFIASSTHNPEQALRDGALREDFHAYLNEMTIHMPSLRERVQDIPLLAEALAIEQAEALGGKPVSFTAEAVGRLQSCVWRGNVRELRNYIERCHILKQGESIDVAAMPSLDQTGVRVDAGLSHDFHAARDAFERSYLLHHLNKHDWNVSRTAEDIGMERSQLHRKIKSFGLHESREDEA